MAYVRSQGFRSIWVKVIVFMVMVGVPVVAFFFINQYRGKQCFSTRVELR